MESPQVGEQVRPFYLGHRPQLDGLRGVAIILVLLHHAGIPYIHGGHIGVDIFFVLSGFLITVLLYREYAEFERIDLKRFYIRRLLRLMPALAGLLVAFSIYALAAKSGAALVKSGQAILVTAVYLSDFAIAFGYAQMGGLSHTWSLAIEEHFYLIYPIALLFLLRKRRPLIHVLAMISVLAFVIAVYRIVLWGPDAQEVDRVFYSFDTRADGILVGCLLGLITASGRLPAVNWFLALSAALVLALAAVFVAWNSALYAYGLPAITVSSALVLAYALNTRVRWLTNPALVWIGTVSYGLYLWHNMIFIIFRERVTDSPWGVLILGSIVSVVCAALSFYLIEKPFLRLKEQLASSLPKITSIQAEQMRSPAPSLMP